MTQEQIVDNVILDLLEDKLTGSRDLILQNTTKSGRRLAMLSILDDDRRLFERFKDVINSEEYCSQYADETTQILRNYIKVADIEKKQHGEVMTPLTLVDEMLDKLPSEVWSNPNLKWLDPCNGVGTFPSLVVKRLMVGLKPVISDDCERYRHIIENMIYVCEIQAKNMFLFHCAFDREDDHELNTYFGSFLDEGFDEHMKNVWGIEKFDIVLGNPPYKQGLHHKFIIKGFDLLNENGYCLILHPSTLFVNRKGLKKDGVEEELISIVHQNYCELYFFRSVKYFTDVFIHVPLSITKLIKQRNNTIIVDNKYTSLTNSLMTIDSINDIYIHGNPIVKNIKEKIFNKMNVSIEEKLYPNEINGNYYLAIARLTGHRPKNDDIINPDFYTIINKKYENDFDYLIKENLDNYNKGQIVVLENYNQCFNTSRYLITKFARFSVSLTKIGTSLQRKELISVPFVNPNVLWTDEMLFDYFELTQEERDYINSFIPNYYERDFQNITN